MSLVWGHGLPAKAGTAQLLGWHYDPKLRALEFALSGGSAPQLSFYDVPSRLVIDLPGVQLARSFRTAVRDAQVLQVRAGQINSATGRLVLELASAPDMQQVRLVQVKANRWRVQLPPVNRPLPAAPDSSPAAGYIGGAIPLTSGPVKATPAVRSSPVLPNLSASAAPPPVTVPPSAYLENFVFTPEGFLIRTSGPTEASVRRLDGPPRLVVDLPGTVIPNAFAKRVINANRLGVEQVRIGQFEARPPVARIVLDVHDDTWDWEAAYDPRLKGVRLVPAGKLTQPPEVRQGTNLISAALVGDQLIFDADGPLDFQATWNSTTREYQVQFSASDLSPAFQGPELTETSPLDRLRLFPADNKVVTAILKLPAGVFVAGAQRQRDNRQFVVKLARMGQSPLLDARPPGPATAPDLDGSKPLVFVDAGHGGSDPGALGVNGIQEKDVNLSLALLVGRRLTELGYRVGYTRRDDRFVTLQGRVDLAEQAKADLFISLHQNASDSPWAQGIETYYLRPNSSSLAGLVHRAVVRTSGRPDRGVRQARFYVIRYTSMPAILLESGYVTNSYEARQLVNGAQQQRMAESIALVLDRFIKGKR